MRIFIFISFTIAILSCSQSESNKKDTINKVDRYDSIPLVASSFLPDDGTTFRRTKEPNEIPRDEAHSALGSSAKRYWDYGFIGLASVSYKISEKDISVEISQFATKEEAYGFYALLRPIGTLVESIGVEGYTYGKSLYFCQEKFVIVISSLEDDDSGNQYCRLLAIQISVRIGKAGEIPQQFSLFPNDSMIKPSEQYAVKDFLNIKNIRDVYSVRCLVNQDTLHLFAALDTSGNQFFQISEYAKKIGQPITSTVDLPFDENYSLRFPHPTYGNITVGLRSQLLIGIVGYNEQKHQQFLEEWINTL